MNAASPPLVRLVNPVGACEARHTGLAPRLDTLNGKSIGFIDNIKPNAGLFLSYVEEMIRADHPDVRTHAVRKNFTSSKLIAHELEGKVQAVVNAWGDWGGCASWCIHDSEYLERRGVPTSTIVSAAFHRHGRLAAKNLHIDELPLIVTPHPLNDLTPEQVKDLARACYPAIVRQLTGAAAQQKDDIIAFIHPNARSRPTAAQLTGAKS